MNLVLKVARRLKRFAYLAIDDVVMRADLTKLDLAALKPVNKADVTLRDFKTSDLAEADRAFGTQRAELYRARMTSGAFGLLTLVDGKFAGSAWASYLPRQNEGEPPFTYDVQPKAGTVYLFDSFVLPAYRGLGLGTTLKHGLMVRAKQDGKHTVWSVHDSVNSAILGICRKLGHESCGELHYRRIFGAVQRDLSVLGDAKLVD